VYILASGTTGRNRTNVRTAHQALANPIKAMIDVHVPPFFGGGVGVDGKIERLADHVEAMQLVEHVDAD
jgi:hypothetical protein